MNKYGIFKPLDLHFCFTRTICHEIELPLKQSLN